MYIFLDMDNISKPLFQWQIKSFVQWPLTWALIPWSLLSESLFTHFATNVGDNIQISKYPNAREGFWATQDCFFWPPSLETVPLETPFHVLPDKPGRVWSGWEAAWTRGSWRMGSHRAKCAQSGFAHHRIETTSVNHRHFQQALEKLNPWHWVPWRELHLPQQNSKSLFPLPRYKGEGQCSWLPTQCKGNWTSFPISDHAGKTAPLLLLSLSSRESLLKTFWFWCICID